MTSKIFYEWQRNGGIDDIMRLYTSPEKVDIQFCTIGGISVNHRVAKSMVLLKGLPDELKTTTDNQEVF